MHGRLSVFNRKPGKFIIIDGRYCRKLQLNKEYRGNEKDKSFLFDSFRLFQFCSGDNFSFILVVNIHGYEHGKETPEWH